MRSERFYAEMLQKLQNIPHVWAYLQVTDVAMARNMTTLMISGPSPGPFSWSSLDRPPSHLGLPAVYNFSWVLEKPNM